MENKKGNSVLLTIIGVATLLVALVGATFAYFSASATSTNTDAADTGELKISSSLDEGTNNTNIIPTIFPGKTVNSADTTEDESLVEVGETINNDNYTALLADTNIARFNLTVTGTGTTVRNAKYDLTLTGAVAKTDSETASTDALTDADNGVASAEQGGARSDVRYVLLQDVTTDGTTTHNVIATGVYDETDIIAGKQLKTGVDLTGSTNDTYTLCVYINETGANQDKLQSASISAAVTADAYTPKTGA